MKKSLFIGLVLGMSTISGFVGNKIITTQAEKQTAAKMETAILPGPDCKVAFERKCYFGNSLVILPGQVTDAISAQNFCTYNPISCSLTECTARISVLAGILPGSPKADSCLPAGYRGK